MDAQLAGRHGIRRRAYARRERELAALSERQHGVVSRRQLLDAGLGRRAIGRRVEAGRLRCLHRCVYAFGYRRLDSRGEWMAAVLACGEGAVLSHRSAAALWRLMRSPLGSVEVSAARGRRRQGITIHEGSIVNAERTVVAGIPVTSVARTLFDLAEVVDEKQLGSTFEEADRLRILRMPELEAVCARGHGRRALKPIRTLIDAARTSEDTQSPLEDRVLDLCHEHRLPLPVAGARVLGREVDALWPDRKLMVEADSWEFHGHREAFERDRARDAAMQAEGYRVIRLTHRRLDQEPATVASQLRRLLASAPGGRRAVT
jgi:very-short-patch-repair endonuclease